MTTFNITKAPKLPGSTTGAFQYNVDVNGSPFGAIVKLGKGSDILVKLLDGTATHVATLADAKVAMMDHILAA